MALPNTSTNTVDSKANQRTRATTTRTTARKPFMTKKTTLVDLLDAEWQKSCALLMMRVDIENGDFDYAIENHFEYFYWNDIWQDLYRKHSKKYWLFKAQARGDV